MLLMQGARHHEGKFSDWCLKKVGVLRNAEVFPAHGAGRRRQGGPAGVFKLLACAQ